MKRKTFLTAASVFSIAGLLWLTSCEKDPTKLRVNHPPQILSLAATPTIVDWNEISTLRVVAQDPDGDRLSATWSASGGRFLLTSNDSARWQAPDSSGSFTCTVSVSDGQLQADSSLVITVINVVFADDFSGTLAAWNKSYCDAWISSGEAHVRGNASGYYGTLYHSFSNSVTSEYTVKMRLSRVSAPISSDYYGLFTRVNDMGYIAVTNFWFTVWPGSSGQNWALLAFLSAGSQSQWAFLASDSRGNSPLIKTGMNQWNDVSLTVESDKTIVIKVGDVLLYQSDEIRNIENAFGITITTDLTQIGIRTTFNFEVKGDDVQITKTGRALIAGQYGNEIRLSSPDGQAQNSLVSLTPSQLFQLPTLAEVLRGLLKR